MGKTKSNSGQYRYNVTVLSPTPTSPLNFGNRKRINSVCRSLQGRGFEVSFIFYPFDGDWRDDFNPAHLEIMRREWKDVELVIPSNEYHPYAIGEDHLIDEWWDPALETHLKWHFRSRHVDAFLVNYTYLSKAFEFAPDSCVKILDTHDKFGERRQLLASLNIAPEFFHTTIEEEAKGLDRSDIVLALKTEERDYFASLTDKTAITLPYCEDIKALSSRRTPKGGLKIGIIGARNNINYQNISAFLNIALPLFREYMAPVTIILAGGMCKDFQAYAHDPYVNVIGYVDSVEEFYENVDLIAVPMEKSSGQKIKTGEALATSRPVIGHRHAFEGYETNEPLHQLESFEALAEACMMLSFSPEKLLPLAKSSKLAVKLQKSIYERAIDKLIHEFTDLKPKSLIVARAEDLAKDLFFRAHIETLIWTTDMLPQVLMLEGKPDQRCLDYLSKISKYIPIYSTEKMDDEAFHFVRSCAKASDIFNIWKIKLVWLYSDLLLTDIYKHKIKVANSDRFSNILDGIPGCEVDSTHSYMGNMRFGRITQDRSKTLTFKHEANILASTYNIDSLKAITQTSESPRDRHLAIVAKASDLKWVIFLLEYISPLNFKVSLVCGLSDLDIFKENLKSITKHNLNLELDILTDSYDPLKIEDITHALDLTQGHPDLSRWLSAISYSIHENKSAVSIWKFPSTQTLKLTELLESLNAYLSGSSLNLPRDASGGEMFYEFQNYLKDHVVDFPF